MGTYRDSDHRKLAGEKGYRPVSLGIDPDTSIVAKHWDAPVEGATQAGRVPDRSAWRLIHDVYVVPTNAQARDLAMGAMIRRCWLEVLLSIYLGLGLGPFFDRDPSTPDEALDLKERTGGFGQLLIVSYDPADEREAWERSLQALVNEVRPLVQKHLSALHAALMEAVQ